MCPCVIRQHRFVRAPLSRSRLTMRRNCVRVPLLPALRETSPCGLVCFFQRQRHVLVGREKQGYVRENIAHRRRFHIGRVNGTSGSMPG